MRLIIREYEFSTFSGTYALSAQSETELYVDNSGKELNIVVHNNPLRNAQAEPLRGGVRLYRMTKLKANLGDKPRMHSPIGY